LDNHIFFLEKINIILKKHLSQKSFDLWKGIEGKISNNCWNKPTSSTLKYHLKEDGRCPSVIEHTYEMIYAADKIISSFEGIISKNVIFLSIILHDSYKYGLEKTNLHTVSNHDKIIYEIIKKNEKIFLQALSPKEVILLETAVRYHHGKWSTGCKQFSINDFTAEVMILHFLDMMSSKNLIKIIEEK